MSTPNEFDATGGAQPNPESNPQPGSGESTPFERMAGAAREQAGAAADALRRGEFMHEAAVDPGADRDDKLIAMLAYVSQILIPFLMPVIILLSESAKKRPFQRYHAVQSLALSLLFLAIAAAAVIGTGIVQVVPVIGTLVGLLMLCLMPIGWFMAVIALLYYGYQAYQGKRFAVPGLTSTLKDQGWI